MTFSHESMGKHRPSVIVALTEPQSAQKLCSSFVKAGWFPQTAKSGSEIRRLARLTSPELVVMSTDFPDESGWLVTDKLTRELPWIKVFLVGHKNPSSEELALFVGAVDLLDASTDVDVIVEEVCGFAPIMLA